MSAEAMSEMLRVVLICTGLAGLFILVIVAFGCGVWTLLDQRRRLRVTREDAAAKAAVSEAYLIVEREYARYLRERNSGAR